MKNKEINPPYSLSFRAVCRYFDKSSTLFSVGFSSFLVYNSLDQRVGGSIKYAKLSEGYRDRKKISPAPPTLYVSEG